MARLFSRSQRFALWMAAGGKCERCGGVLERGWHADHVRPYSRGGETDVLNGQALCPRCNEQKGARMATLLGAWPGHDRDWQSEALTAYRKMAKADFLAVATPGAGKTTFALHVAHDLLREGRVSRVAVVVPSENLQGQWAQDATRVGIHLTPEWKNNSLAESADFHGVVVTYQQVAMLPDFHRIHCARPTLVIFDEIHHAGDGEGLSWGPALKRAFNPAVRRLLLSGTPFRSDNNRIPFVTYDAEGRSIPDYNYGYGAALGDSVCRPVVFPAYEGEMRWQSSSGQIIRAGFTDSLEDGTAAERLRTALHPHGAWLESVIREANDKISDMRRFGHPNAAGLVVALDQNHAQEIAQVVTRLTGERAVTATYDDPDASRTIDRFRNGSARWIVAVRMVSEGVDIPRLRAVVYATNVMTELYFRQVIGRVVRWIDGIEEQTAYVYIPAVDRLMEFAQQIKQERDHQLSESLERARSFTVTPDGPEDVTRFLTSLYLPIDSSEARLHETVHDGEIFTPADIEQARAVKRAVGAAAFVPDEVVAQLLRAAGKEAPASAAPPAARRSGEPVATMHEVHKVKRAEINKKLGVLAGQYQMKYAVLHGWLNKQTGVVKLAHATTEQLDRQIELLASKEIMEFIDDCKRAG